jgi:hypothetical protein
VTAPINGSVPSKPLRVSPGEDLTLTVGLPGVSATATHVWLEVGAYKYPDSPADMPEPDQYAATLVAAAGENPAYAAVRVESEIADTISNGSPWRVYVRLPGSPTLEKIVYEGRIVRQPR